jgi:hypothetical protein
MMVTSISLPSVFLLLFPCSFYFLENQSFFLADTAVVASAVFQPHKPAATSTKRAAANNIHIYIYIINSSNINHSSH